MKSIADMLPTSVRRLAAGLLGLWLGAAAFSGAQAAETSNTVRTDQAEVQLLAYAPQGLVAGGRLQLGLRIRHAPHWHTYWKNPGDSGLPTQLNWTLPAGWAAGGIAWPTPQKMPVGPMVNYGFDGELLLPVSVTLPQALPAGPATVALEATWLICKDVCIPESGQFQLQLDAAPSTQHRVAFEAAAAAQPHRLQTPVEARVEGTDLVLKLAGLPSSWLGQAVVHYGGDAGVIDHAQPEASQWQGSQLTVRVPLSPTRSESPAQLSSVLQVGSEAVELAYALQGAWPSVSDAPPAAPGAAGHAANPAPTPPASAPGVTPALGLTLLLAFAGGALLNLMPCVFPVLSLKALALVNEAPSARRAGAVAYTLGVVLSLLALAGLLLVLRAAGDQIGWGFQLQQPTVVAGLAVLFTLLALNLFGVFEFGTWAPSGLAGWRARQPWVDQFATGVLAVAVASPCTAPFMGAALGAALTLPAWATLAVFAALGLGLAAPYAVLALWPPLARRLPRPGAWMARLRTVLGFPMLATVLWLVWVLGMQLGLGGAVALLVLLLALSFAVWAWAQGTAVWRGAGLLVLLAGLAWMAPSFHPAAVTASERATADAPPGGATGPASPSARWQPWSPALQAELLAKGEPVFVDFTAAWCITCQFNKRGALADPALLADFAARGVHLLRADWTLRDATITAALQSMQRSGVPVYALHVPGASGPVLLPEILSVNAVQEALAEALPRAPAPAARPEGG